MPDALASAPSTTINIRGLTVPYTRRYAPGHVCNAAEAQALDITTAENIRNNCAKRVLDAVAEAKVEHPSQLGQEAQEALLADILAYSKAYSLGLRASHKADPIELLARKLAREALHNHLRQRGIDPKSKPADWLDAQVDHILKTNEWFQDEAQRRTDAAKEAAGQLVHIKF